MNIKSFYQNNKIVITFLVKFVVAITIFTYSFDVLAGITSPDNYYSKIIDEHLNVVKYFRLFLLHSTKFLLHIFGVETYMPTIFHLKKINGYGIHIVYSCLGLGVISFWSAFIVSFPNTFKQKIKWFLVGNLVVILLNIIRLSVLIVIANKSNANFEYHHEIYNYTAYSIIFLLIYFYVKKAMKN